MTETEYVGQKEMQLLGLHQKLAKWRQVIGLIIFTLLIVFLLCILSVSPGNSQDTPDRAPAFFLTGNKYLQQNADNRLAYLKGLFDGVQLSKAFEPKKDRFYPYLEGKTPRQIMAAVDKYLKEHPEQASKPMNFIFFYALIPQQP
jgi:hypothetical protein